MMLQKSPIITANESLYLKQDKFELFFGNKKDEGKEYLNEIECYKINQVHEDQFVIWDFRFPFNEKQLARADAHLTQQKNTALRIRSADCLPIMVYDVNFEMIVAIHAGWRGIQNKITSKLVSKMFEMGSKAEGLQFFIGPHIQQKSFEIETDLAMKIIGSSASKKIDQFQRTLIDSNGPKCHLNLSKILKIDLSELGIEDSQIWISEIDTFENQNFHSYRRDHIKGQNQSSWIFLK